MERRERVVEKDWRYSRQGGRLPGFGPPVYQPLPRRQRPTGLTPPVALVATGAVVGATTAMTAPVATSATKRPLPSRPAARRHVLRTRRVRRVHVLTVLVALASLVARAPRRTAAFASTPHPPSPPPLGGEAKRTRVAAQAATPLLSARCPGSDSSQFATPPKISKIC